VSAGGPPKGRLWLAAVRDSITKMTGIVVAGKCLTEVADPGVLLSRQRGIPGCHSGCLLLRRQCLLPGAGSEVGRWRFLLGVEFIPGETNSDHIE